MHWLETCDRENGPALRVNTPRQYLIALQVNLIALQVNLIPVITRDTHTATNLEPKAPPLASLHRLE